MRYIARTTKLLIGFVTALTSALLLPMSVAGASATSNYNSAGEPASLFMQIGMGATVSFTLAVALYSWWPPRRDDSPTEEREPQERDSVSY